MIHAATKTELAGNLGAARSTLDRWLQLPGFPKKTKAGWNVESCIAFIKSEGLREPSHITEERRLLVRAQRLLAEQRLRRESGELCDVAQVKAEIARIYGIFVGIIKRTVSREDYNTIARQFQSTDFKL